VTGIALSCQLSAIRKIKIRKSNVMKIKALVEGILGGVVSAIFCYRALISPATLAAIAISRKMPDAWFSGLITWYAMFAVIRVSMAVAGVAGRLVYKDASTPSA
jgi:hypothetical protein